MKKIEDVMNYGQNKPDLYFQRKSLGFIRFQGRIVRVGVNFGSFATLRNEKFQVLPEIFKVMYFLDEYRIISH